MIEPPHSTKLLDARGLAAQARLFAEVAADCSAGILPGDYSEAGISDLAAETEEIFWEMEMRAEAEIGEEYDAAALGYDFMEDARAASLRLRDAYVDRPEQSGTPPPPEGLRTPAPARYRLAQIYRLAQTLQRHPPPSQTEAAVPVSLPVTYADRVAYIDRVVQAVRRAFIPYTPAPRLPHLGTIVLRASPLPDVSPPPLLPTGGTIPPDALRTPAEVARKLRKPSIRTLVKQAEKATGKPVMAITLPDGTKLDFGNPDSAKHNEVDEWIAQHARAPERH